MLGKDCKILVVDDMSTMRKVIKRHLTDIGYAQLSEAENGLAAWNLLDESVKKGEHFGLVVSDWNMPEMTGFELLKKIRTVPQLKTLPFLFVTAESEEAGITEALKIGASDYLVKPFTRQALEEKLNKIASPPAAKAA